MTIEVKCWMDDSDCPECSNKGFKQELQLWTVGYHYEGWSPGEVRVLCRNCSETYAGVLEDDEARLLGEIRTDGYVTTSLIPDKSSDKDLIVSIES